MNNFISIKKSVLALSAGLLLAMGAQAGNPDRAGSAGAGQLLINPWARSGGLANASMASVRGIESSFLNIAGLAFVERTELIFTNNQYLVGTDIQLNSLGFAQKVGESGVLGISVTSMSFGDIAITTEDLPDGGIGNFSPTYSNFGISYAKEFSNSIYGGLTLRVLSESIANVRAQGVCFDAGIRYVTGENDQLRFGISLKNVGPPMRFRGDGLSVTAEIPTTGEQLTVDQRSATYELPSLVHIGFAYDFVLNEDMLLTANGQYTSNSFTQDQFGFGAEFGFKERLILRAGYMWEPDITSDIDRTTVLTGPGAGLTLQIPTGANGTIIGLDYSYRTTSPFDGIHAIGVHIDL